MKFKDVAQSFAQIEATPSRNETTALLADLLSKATPEEAAIICNVSLGQLNPPYVGTLFNVAEKNMVKILAALFDESEKIVEQERKKVGDLGSLLDAYTWDVARALTVEQVNDALHTIEHLEGTGSQEKKSKQLQDLLHALDPLSAKYVVRIILGKLRLGFSDMTLIDALSWMVAGDKSLRPIIEHAYNICVDIGLIAKTLKADGIKALEHMRIQVGVPIRPAAAERLPTAQAIYDKIGNCVAQPKLDGFRLQIHMDCSKKTSIIKFFSRNLIDMSTMFPDIVDILKDLSVSTLICEGEAIVYDPNTGQFVPFQETVKRKRKHGVEQAAQDMPLRVFVFDILYLNGTSLLDKGHEERRALMLDLFKRFNRENVQAIQEDKMHSAKELEHYFITHIEAGLEGLIAKRPNAPYTPGKRNFNWIKLKRQEEGHLEDTIDCVILGYYGGHGKRATFGIGAFLVGVFNPEQDRFETVAKIGTGMTDAEWRDLKKQCDANAVDGKPKNVMCPKELYPDVWVSPDIVCQIRADEITQSPLHTAAKTDKSLGYALRFPRFMGYRPDKKATQATDVDEIKHLYDDQFLKS